MYVTLQLRLKKFLISYLGTGLSTLYAGSGGGASVSPPFLTFAKFP